MECNFCKGIGKLKVDEQIVICYACEGCKEIEACISCNGTGEKVFENKPIVVFTNDGEKEQWLANNYKYEFGPCMLCMGNCYIPKVLFDEVNKKGDEE